MNPPIVGREMVQTNGEKYTTAHPKVTQRYCVSPQPQRRLP